MKTAMLCALLLLVGCKKQEAKKPEPEMVKLSGQVFIVLNNRETIKLSLVPIGIVPEQASRDIVATHKDREQKYSKAKADYEAAKLDRERAEGEAGKVGKRKSDAEDILKEKTSGLIRGQTMLQEAVEEFKKGNPLRTAADVTEWQRDYHNAANRLVEWRKEIADTKLKITELTSDYGVAITNLSRAMDLELRAKDALEPFSTGKKALWERLALKQILSVPTDADGKFSIQFPKTNFCVVAYATRKTPGSKEDEEYFWFLPVTNAADPVMLNNANLFGDN